MNTYPSLLPRLSLRIRFVTVAAGVATLGFCSILLGQQASMLAIMVLLTLLGIYGVQRRLGIYLAITFLIVLGDVRRIVAVAFGFPANDPLVLVGPVFVGFIVAPVFLRLRLSDLPSKLVFGVLLIAMLQVFNPAQGGLIVGVSGALIFLPPLLWFWVGRTIGTEETMIDILYHVIVPLAVLAAFVGFYQVYIGFLPWQKAWVEQVHSTYAALYIGGNTIRAFGFSVASSEYSNLLMLGSMISVAGFLTGRRVVGLALIPLLPALVLASSRGSVLRLLMSASIAWALRGGARKMGAVRLLLALCVGFGALALVLAQFGDYSAPQTGGRAVDYALAHQAAGLSHPLDARYSSAGSHSAEILTGFATALSHPIGYGVGSTNIAATKYGLSGLASEFDISDAFISLGVPGGVLYLAMIISLSIAVLGFSKSGPAQIVIPVASMMLPMYGNWMFPGEYSSGAFFWLLIGSVMGLITRHQESQRLLTTESRPAIPAVLLLSR